LLDYSKRGFTGRAIEFDSRMADQIEDAAQYTIELLREPKVAERMMRALNIRTGEAYMDHLKELQVALVHILLLSIS